MSTETQDHDLSDDDRVMSFLDWCKINSISTATGRRIISSGQGPRVLELSARRIGIRHGDNRRWQNERVRGG
jgi:hypothetical protein